MLYLYLYERVQNKDKKKTARNGRASTTNILEMEEACIRELVYDSYKEDEVSLLRLEILVENTPETASTAMVNVKSSG